MKSTGMVRKIDELGRIVIPKEIRDTLNIRNSENMEIYVEENKIVLKKYHKMNKFIENIKSYINMFDNLIDSSFLILDREKVIVTSKEYESLNGKKITKFLINTLEDRRQVLSKKPESLNAIEGNSLIASFLLLPIIVDATVFGGILCVKNDSINDLDILSSNVLNYLIKSNL